MSAKVFVVEAPVLRVGEGTLIRALLERLPCGFELSISATAREDRAEGEVSRIWLYRFLRSAATQNQQTQRRARLPGRP